MKNLTELLQKEYIDIEEITKQEIKQSSHYGIIQTLFEKWISYVKDRKNGGLGESEFLGAYHCARNILIGANTKYSQGDISTLSLAIPLIDKSNSHWNALFLSGLFLSALINNHYENTHTQEPYLIITKAFEGEGIFGGEDYSGPEQIGLRNSGSIIIVDGNVGDYLGKEMDAGKIIVNGMASKYIGIGMTDGEIYIKKGCEEINIAQKINKNGKIVIDGEIKNIQFTNSYLGREVIHNGVTLNKGVK